MDLRRMKPSQKVYTEIISIIPNTTTTLPARCRLLNTALMILLLKTIRHPLQLLLYPKSITKASTLESSLSISTRVKQQIPNSISMIQPSHNPSFLPYPYTLNHFKSLPFTFPTTLINSLLASPIPTSGTKSGTVDLTTSISSFRLLFTTVLTFHGPTNIYSKVPHIVFPSFVVEHTNIRLHSGMEPLSQYETGTVTSTVISSITVSSRTRPMHISRSFATK
jgi:hypothetical protein